MFIKKVLGFFLTMLGCKNLGLMLYAFKRLDFKLLVYSVLHGDDYIYLGPDALEWENATKFKKHIFERKYKEKLVEGLDQKSVDTINQIEKNLKFVLEGNKCFDKKLNFGIRESELKINEYIKNYTKDIYLPINHKEQSVFYYKHGIYQVPGVRNQLKGKDLLDCGAFIGDTAIMFSKEFGFGNRGLLNHIYCLEPEPANFNLLNMTIYKNGMKGNIIPIGLGVGDKKEVLYMDGNSSCATIKNKESVKSTIEVDTIDNIVKNYKVNPGIIKRDIEGMEYNSLLGAEETIRKYKPILLISIYHNGKDFYEIKPKIESWDVGYKFKIRHLSTRPRAETLLICF